MHPLPEARVLNPYPFLNHSFPSTDPLRACASPLAPLPPQTLQMPNVRVVHAGRSVFANYVVNGNTSFCELVLQTPA